MLGDSHVLVANLALASLTEKERHILYPRWGGIESGATLSDHFRIMWESVEPGSKEKQLVHRCFVDSQNTKDHGCITRSLDHAEGSIAFITDYLSEPNDSYTEDEFLENLGMFLGIACHHIADLCTPVHVGHLINFRSLGCSTLARFHNRVERDIRRLERKASIRLPKPQTIVISSDYFWEIAKETYEQIFIPLQDVYMGNEEKAKLNMVTNVITSAVKHTANIWHTVLTKTKMTERKWSMQPLL